jgi:hypothetical protein
MSNEQNFLISINVMSKELDATMFSWGRWRPFKKDYRVIKGRTRRWNDRKESKTDRKEN